MKKHTGKRVADIVAPTSKSPSGTPGATERATGAKRRAPAASDEGGAAPAASDGATRTRGRPTTSDEPWAKYTIVLYERQRHALEDLTADIYRRHRQKVAVSQILRAAVDAILDAGVDLTGATSEDDVRRAIGARLKRQP